MKKLILLFFIGIVTMCGSDVFAKRPPVFFSWGGDTFYKVADLPDTDQFKFNNDLVDIGVKYSEVQIFFLPIWQYDMKYVGIIPNDNDNYYDFSEQEVLELAKSASISIPPVSQISLDFWTAWGGKIVFVMLIALFVMYGMLKTNKEEAT